MRQIASSRRNWQIQTLQIHHRRITVEREGAGAFESKTQLDLIGPDLLDALRVVAGKHPQFSPQQILFKAIQPRQTDGGSNAQSLSLPVLQ